MRILFAAILILGPCAGPAAAVLISTGNGAGNTTAPSDDPGFANVAVRGSGAAVYLGNGWMLTANHLGAGPTIFGNTTYNVVPNSAVQVRNPAGAGFTPLTDLLLYKIDAPPPLPALKISDSPPVVGWQVTMIGNGRDRQPSLAAWSATWAPVSPPGTYSGYIWSSTTSKRWGTNVIDQINVPQGLQTNSQTSFITSFSSQNATPYEAQGTNGDSGGAVFHKDTTTGEWELAGIMFAINIFGAQPWGVSVFGNLTYSADLSVYRNQILSTIALPGDFNLDGRVDLTDVNIVGVNWMTSGPAGDANHDGIVNLLDIQVIGTQWTGDAAAWATAIPEPATLPLAALAVTVCLAAAVIRRRLPVGARRKASSQLAQQF